MQRYLIVLKINGIKDKYIIFYNIIWYTESMIHNVLHTFTKTMLVGTYSHTLTLSKCNMYIYIYTP